MSIVCHGALRRLREGLAESGPGSLFCLYRGTNRRHIGAVLSQCEVETRLSLVDFCACFTESKRKLEAANL